MQFHVITDKYKSVECVPQIELQDLHGNFYIDHIKQLQPLFYIFCMNGAQIVFWKTKLDHPLGGYFWAIPMLYGINASFVVRNNC